MSSAQRRSAEEVLLNFRKTKSPYTLCREILETTQVHYVLFEAAELLKNSLIREWAYLETGLAASLRQYLLHYVMATNLPFYVRERILQVIAIIVKRGSVDDNGEECKNILKEVESLVANGAYAQKQLGLKIVLNLMNEYSFIQKSTDVGLPWEVHVRVRKRFQQTSLMRIFQFTVEVLSCIIQMELRECDRQVLSLLEDLLNIVATVLTWRFLDTDILYYAENMN